MHILIKNRFYNDIINIFCLELDIKTPSKTRTDRDERSKRSNFYLT